MNFKKVIWNKITASYEIDRKIHMIKIYYYDVYYKIGG